MGLDTTHDCFHGAYSSFTRWRNEVALAAGYQVLPVDYQGVKYDTVMIDWGHLPPNALMGEWPETPADPLMVIIAHSDCDGDIMRAQQIALADRLDELAPLLESKGEGGGHIARAGGYAEICRQFARGLRAAHAAGKTVGFH